MQIHSQLTIIFKYNKNIEKYLIFDFVDIKSTLLSIEKQLQRVVRWYLLS